MVRHITKSDSRPYILYWRRQLGKLLWSDSFSLRWTFKWRRNFPRPLPTGRCYCTHTARVSMTTLLDMFGDRIISKNIWPPLSPDFTPLDYYLWGAMRSAVYKDSSHTPWTERSYRRFHQEHPSVWTVVYLCKQDKMCRCVSTRTWWPFPMFLVT
jgi:hypothetical protein